MRKVDRLNTVRKKESRLAAASISTERVCVCAEEKLMNDS